MLKIRSNQQEQVANGLFIERLRQHWQETFSHKFSGLSKDDMGKHADDAVREAQAKGIDNEDDIVVYADLCLTAESGFASEIKSQEKKPNA